MNDNKFIIVKRNGKILTAVMEQGRIAELLFDPEDLGPKVGDIYVGKIKKILKNIQAAFVDIGGKQMCYCPLCELPKDVKEGDELPVQIAREAVKTKEPVATGRISLAGRYSVVTLGKGGLFFSTKIKDNRWKEEVREKARFLEGKEWGCIIRTNAYTANANEVLAEAGELSGRMEELLKKARARTCYSCLYQAPPAYVAAVRDCQMGGEFETVTDEPKIYETLLKAKEEGSIFSSLRLYQDSSYSLSKLYSLETVIKEALSKRVWLKSGGYLVIEPTEALTVIDVNTGKFDGKKDRQETFRRINLEAAREALRQVRLRNISGIILIDFIDMEGEDRRKELMAELASCAAADRLKTTVVDITRLNLVEITRKRERKPLWEQIGEEMRG